MNENRFIRSIIGMMKKMVSTSLFFNTLTGSILCLFLIRMIACFNQPALAGDCEIVNTAIFERQQQVIATDWRDGLPYMRYKTEIYPCANITFRNTGWLGAYTTDVEVTATFTDQSTKNKRIECGKKHLEPGEDFSCSVCFESDFPIAHLECRFR
jgi:hypothetical protein